MDVVCLPLFKTTLCTTTPARTLLVIEHSKQLNCSTAYNKLLRLSYNRVPNEHCFQIADVRDWNALQFNITAIGSLSASFKACVLEHLMIA